ncbi:CoA-binding protein [Arthrobacter sp. UM1]|uniref:CoA-binding protein n=1 Tax=Arthrobacter sp. UM1 TaxID=2766776 RepID=UPI001CF70197|nr:CoA-binding protein [Arthrobacter sp. UM1]MCB4208523.1 CoA-binding protein [Arthrobacter sp. UM1]
MSGAVEAGRAWQGPSAPERLGILRAARSIAIVGASGNPARASYFVATYLQGSAPYRLYFVNPRADEILGQKAYASLADLPEVPDIVDVFRKDADLPGVLDEVLALGEAGSSGTGVSEASGSVPGRSVPGSSSPDSLRRPVLWLQLGSWNEDVARRAEAAGLRVVMDRCVKIEHARFHGGLRLNGFNTGVLSSRRQVLA